MNPYFAAGILLPSIAVIILQLVVMRSHRAFLAAIPLLRDTQDMLAFKHLAATNMYLALVAIGLGILPWAVWIVGLVKKNLPFYALMLLFVPSVIMLVVGLKAKEMEKRVQSMPAADPALAAERDRVVDAWLHKPFPNW